MSDRTRAMILKMVDEERDRQDKRWGGVPGIDRHDEHTYPAVLTEEVGEVCKEWLERNPSRLYAELIQVAAVAVAWIEEIERGGWKTREERTS